MGGLLVRAARYSALTDFETSVNSVQSGLHIERATFLNEFGEAIECFHFRRHCVEEGGREDVHSLDVCKPEMMGLLPI